MANLYEKLRSHNIKLFFRLKLKYLRQTYGATETCGSILFESKDLCKLGSVGTNPVNQGLIKVRNPETHELLGPNQRGEICVKNNTVMKGYLDNPEATLEAFDQDGFFLTGDIGYYDEDRCFFIVDRLKEIIKYKGFQVSLIA